MKRDWDIIREILLKVEEKSTTLTLSDFDDNKHIEIIYHVRLLKEAVLINASIHEFTDGAIFDIESISWNGHDFLDSIRDKTIWDKTKSQIAEKGGAMTFELVKSVAIKIATALVL